MGALRVGNNGLTTVVDPGGRGRVSIEPYQRGTATVEVVSLERATRFTATGDLVGPVAGLIALLLVAVSAIRQSDS